MNEQTKAMIREWLRMHKGDVEGVARWMRDSLKMAGLKECRRLVLEAMK